MQKFIAGWVWMCLFVCFGGGSAKAARVEEPVDVGVGPATYFINNPIFLHHPVNVGLKISVAAVINRALIRRYRGKIPARYRRLTRRLREVKLRPLVLGLIPDSLIISPTFQGTQIYGVIFRPFALGLGIPLGPLNVSLSAGILLNYTYIISTTQLSPGGPTFFTQPAVQITHFLRPGIDAKLEFELPISEHFLISFGWASQVYVPQRLGASPFAEFGPFESWVWHFGQAFLLFHFRFPFETNL